MADRRDSYGRSEAELIAVIERKQRVYAIAAYYGGNEGLAIKLARMKADIEVDKRCLSELRGEPIKRDYEVRSLTPAEREKFYAKLASLGNAGRPMKGLSVGKR